MKDMPALALDQVANHIVGHARGQHRHRFAAAHNRQQKEQRHCVMERRRRRTNGFSQRIDIRPIQKTTRTRLLHRARIQIALANMPGKSRRQHPAIRIEHEKLGYIPADFQPSRQPIRPRLLRIGHGLGKSFQVCPLLVRPVLQNPHSGLGNALKSNFQRLTATAVEPGRPAHGKLAGFAPPGQPVLFGIGKMHRIAGEVHLASPACRICNKGFARNMPFISNH